MLDKSKLIVGVGDGGGRVVSRYLEGRVGEAEKRWLRIECRNSYVTGLDCSDIDLEELIQLIGSASRILVVVCAGGSAGGAMTRLIAVLARLRKIPMRVVISTPASWEGAIRGGRAQALRLDLKGLNVPSDVVISSKFDREDMRSAEDLWNVVGMKMLGYMNKWVSLQEEFQQSSERT